MEKKQAQDYIKQVLNSRFDQEQFELFVRNLLNEFEPRDNNYSGNLIPEAFRDHIAHFKRIGKYTDPEGEPMDILIVQTRSVNKLERTRTALRNFVVRHLKNFDKYYALVAFYSKEDNGEEWRLSLVKIDIEQERTDKGKIKAKEEIVPAKRFSYLVGVHEDAYTAQKQLLPLLVNDHSNPLVVKEKDGDGSIEGAFSIEKVTDEFYEQYKELYLKLTENARLTKALEKESLDSVRFVKKLLGQIVFLYFLQKKGWLGVPKDQKMGTGSKRFLQDRFSVVEDAGGNYFNDFLRYLFYAALAREHNDEGIKYYFKRLGCKIPFLNGGLFEADYDWELANISIPNELFRNKEKNKAGDKGTGILDVFDRYNFTIKEDEPLEKEVAVDPEMLGKVFENMLEITERKSKGAFYTPREIVHYMCQESLIHYLDNTVNDYTESYQSIDNDQTSLFGGSTNKKGNLKIELENKGDIRVPKADIDQLIRQGHLVLEHETTVTGKGKETKSYQYKLPESIRTHAKKLDDALANIKICDPAIGSGAFPVGLLQEIVTARLVLNSFLQNEKHSPYYLKRHAIQESIYGVDIDASAIDIARLRLWLSMIVDEEDYDTIDALPNLDYKIVCGNSLIGMPESAMRDLKVEAELEKLKEQFFHETDETKKKALRQNISQKIRQLLDSAESFAGYKIDFDFKLYFSEVWHYKKGFDVVIGNPPYGVKFSKEEKSLLRRLYPESQFKIDSYSLFSLKGMLLLSLRSQLCYIIPSTLMDNYFEQKVREKLLNEYTVDLVIELSDKVFSSAVVHSMILSVINSKANYDYVIRGSAKKVLANSFDLIPRSFFLAQPQCSFALRNFQYIDILNKLNSNSIPFNSVIDLRQAIKSGDDKKYIKEERIDESYKPILGGKHIKRWQIINPGLYIKYGKHLACPRDPRIFEQPKILLREAGNEIVATLDDSNFYIMSSLYNGILIDSSFSIKYVLGLLNSEIFQFFLNIQTFSKTSGAFTKAKIFHYYPLPIYKASKDQQNQISKLVDFVINAKKLASDLHFKFFEQLLDAIVFELYFQKEIKTAKKQILPHLEDLRPITAEMSEEEKLAIIQSEFERLYDPNHPVRNNLETLDSVEEIRIIKEALK